MLGDAHDVADRVAQPIGMVALEEIGLTDRERIDRLEIDPQIVIAHDRAPFGQREIAVGATEREIEIG